MHRLMLEGYEHENKSFVTLTYGEEHLPDRGSLAPSDLQSWLKRIRKVAEPRKLRFFGVGEYGDQSWRPHYHIALFGWPSCRGFVPTAGGGCSCASCAPVRKTWGKGHVVVGRLEDASCQYIAGYVTKKMTARDDERLQGRYPEFARMSLRPGIGAGASLRVAHAVSKWGIESDVPSSLAHGRRRLPLGRYLRRRVRTELGRDVSAPADSLVELEAEVSVMRRIAWDEGVSVKSVYASENAQFAANVAAKFSVKGRKL